MNTKILLFIICLLTSFSSKLCRAQTITDTIFDRNANSSFAYGADISWLSQLETWGTVFKDDNGTPKDLMLILKEHGINALRFRVWVNPNGGWSGKDDVVSLSKRANDMGFKVMIDFHYSDSWADPGKQNKPEAWENHSFEELLDDVYNHTYEILDTLKKTGITPAWVQIGNETKSGMLWPEGSTSTSMKNFAMLIQSGYNAIKDIDTTIQAIVHLPDADDNGLFRWMFDGLKNNGVKWDIIGMSAYPHWAHLDWETEIDLAVANMKDMISRYDTEVMIVETGHYWYEPYVSNNFLVELMDTMMTFGGLGAFFWEPEAMHGYELTAWNPETQQPTIAMDAFLGVKHYDPSTVMQVSLDKPINGSVYSPDESIEMTANVSHVDGNIVKVAFWVNNELVYEKYDEPYSFAITNLEAGIYILYAEATDENGLVVGSEEVTIQVGAVELFQENAAGYCGIDDYSGTIDSNHSNYTGSGFINTDNRIDVAVNWTVNFIEPGDYNIHFRYAATSTRPAVVIIDGNEAGTLPFPSTGAWNVWAFSSINYTVSEAGSVPISLIAIGGEGLPNIDYLGISSLESSIKAEASEECLDQSGEITSVDSKETKAKFLIFPVPVKDILVVQCSDNITGINIFRADGSLIKSVSNTNSTRIEIPCNDMNTGFYIVQSTAGKKNYVRRFNVVK